MSDIWQFFIDGTYLYATLETLLMTLLAMIFGYVIGLPVGVALTVTGKGGISENQVIYKILDFIVNVMRSIPFLILMILVIPVTRFIVGKSYGTMATVVPLVIAAAPFIARMVESSLKEVDAGVIEAAESLGASKFTIIFKVLIAEARTSLIVGMTIAFGTILGYSAMSGALGGGGLGKVAITYGYNRFRTDIMVPAVIIIVLLVQLFQWLGMKLSRSLDRRIR